MWRRYVAVIPWASPLRSHQIYHPNTCCGAQTTHMHTQRQTHAHREAVTEKEAASVFFRCVWKVKRQGLSLTRTQNLLTCLSKETKSGLFLPPLRHCITVAAFQLWSTACNAIHLAVVTCAPNIQRWNTTHCLPALPPWRLLAGYLHASCAISLFRDPTADFELQSAAQRFLLGVAQAKLGNKKVCPARPSVNE